MQDLSSLLLSPISSPVGARTGHVVILCASNQTTLFVSHLQSQYCAGTPDLCSAHAWNGQLADHKEIFTDIDIKCITFEILTP